MRIWNAPIKIMIVVIGIEIQKMALMIFCATQKRPGSFGVEAQPSGFQRVMVPGVVVSGVDGFVVERFCAKAIAERPKNNEVNRTVFKIFPFIVFIVSNRA